jgi:hypothetical protein
VAIPAVSPILVVLSDGGFKVESEETNGMSEHHQDTSFKWLMFFFVCFASSVLAIGVWAATSYNPDTIKAAGEPDQDVAAQKPAGH